MKLIDKAAVAAEITHKIKVLEAFIKNFDGISDKVEKAKNKIEALGDVLLLINTLEVKEDFKDVKSVFEGQYLSKDKVVITIERLQDECEDQGDNNGVELLEKLFNKLDSIEVKEVDLDALGVLAEHLIACDAHGITPKYRNKELNILEGLANNKAQKGEKV